MKFKFNILTLLLFLAFGIQAHAQRLTVDNFSARTTDLSGRTTPRMDNNDVPCALVKVQLAASGAKFEGNVMGDVAYKTSEYWVYMPKGSKRLTVKLEGYLPLDVEFAQYDINSLESKLTYQLVISGIVVSGEAPRQQTGWLILNSTPSEAEVYLKINGVESLEGTTPFQKKLAYGSYEYRLSKNLYHDEVGVVEVNKSQVELTPSLKPAHGRISVTTNPADAKVVIEGLRESYTTPCTTDILPSGEYQLSISKTQYAAATRTVTVRDGAVTPLHIDLSANYAQVTVNSLPQAEIYLNGAKVSTATYTANLSPGIYDFEARLDGHHAAKRQVEVESNMPQTFTLNPKPFCGSLDVISNPMKASVTIDGKHYGQTPITIDNLLIGSYQVTLTKDGYGSETASVTIEEGKTAEVNRKLSNGKQLTFISTQSGAELYVDGKWMGTTPSTLNLTYGSHSIKVKNSDAEVTDNIQVSATLSKTRYSYELGNLQTFTVNGVSFTMVKVEGGTFTMGATSEQGSDADDDENTHRVTLSSYRIGQTEVTQALWKAVMGNNPSNFKGDNLPVEQVSWDDCQEFIRKLNQLTGKRFRLPSEAEWEYAARGGKKSQGYKYSGSNNIDNVAWYYGNSNSKTHPVKGKSPNELGLYDMSGNVWEWCSDWYGSYGSSSQTNPTGPTSESNRVRRGGSWGSIAGFCRVSYRYNNAPSGRYDGIGFRLALSE